MNFGIVAAAFTLLAVQAASAQTQMQTQEPFEFVALGDMPYNLPGDYEKFDRLISRVNALAPAFTIHVGDIVSGRTRCSEENFGNVLALFARFEGPLIYTPGDNEWTDCHRLLGGGYDPLERLQVVRRMFFPEPGKSLGQRRLTVETQSLNMASRFPAYVENVRFIWNGVQVASAHVVGSLNNFDEGRPGAVAEYEARNAANIAWIDDAFRVATANSAKALVLFWQANVHATPRSNRNAPFAKPFEATVEAVARGAASFGKPVLVVFGDFHYFEVSPFLNMKREPVRNVTRLQVYGDTQVHAVRVRVDPADPAVFGITPLIVPENGVP
jgi:hypothetical protein